MKYRVMVSVNITPETNDNSSAWSTNSLYHHQDFIIQGEKLGDIAPTIDGIYEAIRNVVERHGDG